ncbi:-related lipid transfer 9 [Paramuricea clavata]|uniref:-related lipid transfer 9 n=1 Tax=Paramuricea clavata TaxID=317549 RepID=A0A6S7GNT4_PARCT|nr:-related lipid transfer 9 [Paramuricea clavata]
MALFAYLFYIFTTLAAGILIYYFFNQQKKDTRIGNSPSARYNFVRKILPLGKSNWELISLDNDLRVWAKSGQRSLFATSAILPVSLKVGKEILTDPSVIVEWNPWITTASTISVSNINESSSGQHSGDVISVTETSSASVSLLGGFYSLINLFKNDSKLYARTWHFEEDVQFWLHSAVVEPSCIDPIFTLFMVFPIKEKSHRCQLIIASEPQSSFNPNVLAASLAGLRDLIVDRLYETVLPEIKNDKQDDIVAHGEEDLEDCDDDEQGEEEIDSVYPGQHFQAPSEEFVDVTGVYYSPEKDLQKYKVVTDAALKRLMECYCAEANRNGWCFVGHIKGVEIVKKPASVDFSIWDCAKGTTEINVPVHYLLSYLDDLNRTSEYDDQFDTGQTIESLGALTKIIYLEYKGIWPVSGRDFCSVSAIRVLQDGMVTFFAKHVKHPSCPPCKKYVRGKILTGGFVMKILSEDPPRIKTTYITHVDLQGSVPSRIVNKLTASQPASVGIVKTNVEKMYKDELDNPNRPASKFKADAMAMHEKLQRAREVMAKIPASEEVSEVPAVTSQSAPVPLIVNGDVPLASNSQSNQNLASSPINSSPSIHGSSFEYGGPDYKTIGNQASAGLMQEAFEVSEVDISKPAGPSVYEQWQYQETEKRVLIFRKIHQNEKMHSFIGKGIIACPPPKVWEILREPENSYRYNIMLKETRTLEKLSDTQRIEYLHFQTEKCFKKESRDFIVLKTERKEKDKYLMSFVSVDYPNSPSKKDVKRGKIISSGWVVEPLLHNGQLYSMVTYLAQVSPGGSYPAMLINITGRKQPLCLAYLRRILENPNQSLNRSLSQSLDETDHS